MSELPSKLLHVLHVLLYLQGGHLMFASSVFFLHQDDILSSLASL